MSKILSIFILIVVVLIFFWQVILKGLLPIPADTIVGLYHPYRDLYAKDYPRGIPFKNSLITDPVRQQYPWKNLALDLQKKLELPLWNPYNFGGYPLLANFQSSSFYPLNFLFYIFEFKYAWAILIIAQPLLAGIFLFLYLENLKLDRRASILGAIAFAFSGFSIAWLEWGNILNTALWLPLLLLASDKIISYSKEKTNKNIIRWALVYFFALTSSFFAGHLQIFFYLFVVSTSHYLIKTYTEKSRKAFFAFCSIFVGFLLATSISWVPTISLIAQSARQIDQASWRIEGWFIPWQNIIQFIFPDFFGNPATLNYFGKWNYGEFIGYVGATTIIMALYTTLFVKNKKVYFYIFTLVLGVIFAFPSIISKIPYKLEIPLLETSQPTRLMYIIDFSLCVLAAIGFDAFIKSPNKRKILTISLLFSGIIVSTWVFVTVFGKNFFRAENILTTKRNLIFPSAVFVLSLILLNLFAFLDKVKRAKEIGSLLIIILMGILVFDLFRFGWKFTPFTKSEYLYPQTKTLSFLQKNTGMFRIMETSSSIFPPNFSIMYKLQTLDGYDPLYLQRYAEFMAAMGRFKPDITPPFGFNRIITPQSHQSQLIDFLGVKYVVTLDEIGTPGFRKVFEEGRTKVYRNEGVYNKSFFVWETIVAKSKQEAIDYVFSPYPLSDRAVIEGVSDSNLSKRWSLGQAKTTEYKENRVSIKTSNKGDGFLVLTDSYYPTWHAKIDGKETKIYLTDYAFRGIIVPKGEHEIVFYITLF